MKTTDKPKRYQTLSEAALHFGVSKSIMTRKRKQGKLAMRGDLVDVERSAAAFAKNLHASPVPADGTESFADGQRRKESALANLRELEFATKAGELIPVKEAEAAWFGVTRAIRERLLGLPAQLALEISGMTVPPCNPNTIQVLIDGKLRFALAGLTDSLPKLAGDLEGTS